jgi:chromosome segregation ATPase
MQDMQQRVIEIYIHPRDGGPVMPMKLNLMDIEMAALKLPNEAQRDEVRIRTIADKIKKEFPEVRPYDGRNELALLVRQLGHYTRLNRLVLILPGIIKSITGDSAETSEAVKKKLEDMNKRVEQLARDLRKERDEHEAAKTQLATLKTNYKSLRALYEKVNTQLADAQLHEQQAQQDVERWRKAAQKANTDINKAQQETGAIEVEFKRIKQESEELVRAFKQQQQAWVDKEQELSNLRQQVRESQSAIKNLEETIKKRDQEIERLRRDLGDDDTSMAGSLAAGQGWQSNL